MEAITNSKLFSFKGQGILFHPAENGRERLRKKIITLEKYLIFKISGKMSGRLSIFICLSLIFCCVAAIKPERKCYKNTKTVLSGYWMGKMTDHYFKLKKGNYFQLYERILGLTKIEEHSGTFVQKGDTLVLNFCGGVIPKGLTGEALINNPEEKIILFAEDPSYDQEFQFRKDRR